MDVKTSANISLESTWPAWMRRPEQARYLREVHGIQINKDTLAKYAVKGLGPEAEYRGRFPVSSPAQLDAWARKRSIGAVRNTSEAKQRRAELQQIAA
jgi:hypothetical protein